MPKSTKEANDQQKNILNWLIPISAILLIVSFILYGYTDKNSSRIILEIAGLLKYISGTVVFGWIIKRLLEKEQEDKKALEKEKQDAQNKKEEAERKRLTKEAESKTFRIDLLNDLRAISDDVELAKIHIRSHKSAKTYGDCMRDKIMPACIRLWDVKRSLVDKEDPYLQGAVMDIRAHIHSMIAYLKALMGEFETHYIDISMIQKYQEAAYKKEVEKFKEKFTKSTTKEQLTRFDNSWDIIRNLPFCKNFINEEIDPERTYENFFMGHYKACKKILKSNQKVSFKRSSVAERYDVLRREIGKRTAQQMNVNERNYPELDTSKEGIDLVKWVLKNELK